MTFLLVIAVIVFLFGLVQWAKSGAVLWDIHELTKYRYASPDAEDTIETDRHERTDRREPLQKTIQSMETTMDGLLRSSFKALGALAICVWIFVMFSLVVDMLGFNWLDRLSFNANRLIGNPTVRGSAVNQGGFRSNPARATRSSRDENVRNFRW